MKIVILSAAALALAGCASIQKANQTITSADQLLRDKCAYLESGIGIAQLAVGFVPAAATYVNQGTALATAYCTGGPVTDIPSALSAMERIIVAIRPVAAKVGK